MSQLTVGDTFLIEGRGVVVSGQLDDAVHGFRAGARVRVIRPDGSRLVCGVRGVHVPRSCFADAVSIDLLLEGVVAKEEVPRGSVVALEVG
jgi:translation elongation factor EF-Tu-like GTPase